MVARKLRMGSKDGAGMGGDVNLGYDLDVAVLGVLDYLGDVGFCVETTIGGLLSGSGGLLFTPGNARSVCSPRTHIVQLGVFLYLNTPSLVVTQVPVELIQLVSCHDVEVPFNLLDRDEMPTNVEVAATPRKTRIVKDGAFRQGDMVVRLLVQVFRQHLYESFKGIDQPGLCVGTNKNAVWQHLQEVTLLSQRWIDCVVEGDGDASTVGSADESRSNMHLPERVGDEFGGRRVLGKVLKVKLGAGGKAERASLLHHVGGLGDDIVFSHLGILFVT